MLIKGRKRGILKEATGDPGELGKVDLEVNWEANPWLSCLVHKRDL